MSLLVMNFTEYEHMCKKYQTKKNNLFIFKNKAIELIKEKRMFYHLEDDQLFIFIDNSLYYDVYFFSNKIFFPSCSIDKISCMTLIDKNNANAEYIHKFIDLVNSKSNMHVERNYGVILEMNKIQDDIQRACLKDAEYLKQENLRLVAERTNKYIEQIRALWLNYLPCYNIPFEHLNYTLYPHYNVVCIVNDQNVVCGTYLFFDKNKTREIRHVVVSKEYRRKGLGSILLRYIIRDAKLNEIKFLKTWISEDNKNSWGMHEKIGFVKNGLVSFQFILSH